LNLLLGSPLILSCLRMQVPCGIGAARTPASQRSEPRRTPHRPIRDVGDGAMDDDTEGGGAGGDDARQDSGVPISEVEERQDMDPIETDPATQAEAGEKLPKTVMDRTSELLKLPEHEPTQS
jgi:hypothetical protein